MSRQAPQHVIVYGGTFNPPTRAHKFLIDMASTLFNNTKVVVVPVNDAYCKPDKAPAQNRLEMLQLLLADTSCDISTYEMQFTTICYTINTINEMRKQYPHATIHLMIGSDNLLNIVRWRSAELLLSSTYLLVVNRDVDIQAEISKNVLLNRYQKNIMVVHDNMPDEIRMISSTRVREQIRTQNTTELIKYIPQELIDYVVEKGLYYG